VSIAMVALVWFVPFIGLLGVAPKRNPATLGLFSIVILLGVWTQLWLLIVPSLAPETRSPLGADEVLITLGFAALFALLAFLFLRAFPALDTRQAHLVRPYRPVQPHP
jgi:Ni/Fe-hydrogenase subunit HybB-like protein